MKALFFVSALLVCAHADTVPHALFEQKCSGCHLTQRPHADLMNTMVAPPIMGVMKHVKETKTAKTEAVAFVVDYLFHPTREKAVCQPQVIERFGLMPSQKGNLTKDEATLIAEYLYDNFGYRGMGRN